MMSTKEAVAKKPTYEIKYTLPTTSKQTIISLPVTTTAPSSYTSISTTPKPILTTNGTIKSPVTKLESDSEDAKQNQWTHEETMILINAYRKHQPNTSDDLKAIELWKIIARNLQGKLAKSPQKMYSKWRNLVRTYKAVIKSKRTNIKFAFYNDMKQALQHRPTADLFKKDKKHTIGPSGVPQPAAKRSRSTLAVNTSTEDNDIEEIITDDPLLGTEDGQPADQDEHQQSMELEEQQQHDQEAMEMEHQQQQPQVQQVQTSADKCVYTIIDKSELNDDILLKLKLKSPAPVSTAETVTVTSTQASKPCVFAIINKTQPIVAQPQQTEPQHTTLHDLIQSTTAPDHPVTTYTIKSEPQHLQQQIKYVLHESTIHEQEYHNQLPNTSTNAVQQIVEDEMVDDRDEAEEEEDGEVDVRAAEELKESLRQHLQLSDEGRHLTYKNRIQMLQEEYYREKINFIRMQNERETEQLEIQKRRLQIEERRREVVEALLQKILKE